MRAKRPDLGCQELMTWTTRFLLYEFASAHSLGWDDRQKAEVMPEAEVRSYPVFIIGFPPSGTLIPW